MPLNRKASGRNSGAKFGKGDDKWIMMQVGKQWLDEDRNGELKTRITFGENNEYNWCVRDREGVQYWFGQALGLKLMIRAVAAGKALGTSKFFEKDGSYMGNARIDIRGVATAEELKLGKRNAEQEAWLDVEEQEDEEEEDERPARKQKKTSRPMETARKASKSQPKREYPDLTEDDLEADEEEDDSEETDETDYDDLPM